MPPCYLLLCAVGPSHGLQLWLGQGSPLEPRERRTPGCWLQAPVLVRPSLVAPLLAHPTFPSTASLGHPPQRRVLCLVSVLLSCPLLPAVIPASATACVSRTAPAWPHAPVLWLLALTCSGSSVRSSFRVLSLLSEWLRVATKEVTSVCTASSFWFCGKVGSSLWYPAGCRTCWIAPAPAAEVLGPEKLLVWGKPWAMGCWGEPAAEGCGLQRVGGRTAALLAVSPPCSPCSAARLWQCLLGTLQPWQDIPVVPDLPWGTST